MDSATMETQMLTTEGRCSVACYGIVDSKERCYCSVECYGTVHRKYRC